MLRGNKPGPSARPKILTQTPKAHVEPVVESIRERGGTDGALEDRQLLIEEFDRVVIVVPICR